MTIHRCLLKTCVSYIFCGKGLLYLRGKYSRLRCDNIIKKFQIKKGLKSFTAGKKKSQIKMSRNAKLKVPN